MPDAASTPASTLVIIVISVFLAILISFALVLITFNFLGVFIAIILIPILYVVFRRVRSIRLKEFSQALTAAIGGCLLAFTYCLFILEATVLRNRSVFCLPASLQAYSIYLGVMIVGVFITLLAMRMKKIKVVNPTMALLFAWVIMSMLITFGGWLCLYF